jgi:hypothetical protein
MVYPVIDVYGLPLFGTFACFPVVLLNDVTIIFLYFFVSFYTIIVVLITVSLYNFVVIKSNSSCALFILQYLLCLNNVA